MFINNCSRLFALLLLAIALAGCGHIRIEEAKLSNGQRVATFENTGDGVTPPATVMLIQNRDGDFQPVAGGIGAAVVPSALSGAVGSSVLGMSQIAAARTASGNKGPSVINNVDPTLVAKASSTSSSKNRNILVADPTIIQTSAQLQVQK